MLQAGNIPAEANQSKKWEAGL